MNISIKNTPFINEVEFLRKFDTEINEDVNLKIVQLLVRRIKEQMDIGIKVLDFVNGLSNDDLSFLNAINSLYNISFCDYKDYNNLFSLIFSNSIKPYNRAVINTYMISEKMNYINEKLIKKEKNTSFRIAYADGFIKKDDRYTVEEIKKLLDDGKIIILDEFDSEVMFSKELGEKYEKFEPYRNYDYLNKDNFFYPCIILYFKNIFTNERLSNDVNKYFVNLQTELFKLLSFLSNYGDLKIKLLKELDNKNILFRLEVLIKITNKKKNDNNLKLIKK